MSNKREIFSCWEIVLWKRSSPPKGADDGLDWVRKFLSLAWWNWKSLKLVRINKIWSTKLRWKIMQTQNWAHLAHRYTLICEKKKQQFDNLSISIFHNIEWTSCIVKGENVYNSALQTRGCWAWEEKLYRFRFRIENLSFISESFFDAYPMLAYIAYVDVRTTSE